MATYNLSNGLVTNASDNVVGTDNNDTFEITEGSDFYNGLAASDTLNAISYAHNNVGFDMASGVFTADGDASKSLINFENYLAGFLFGSSDVSHTITGTAGTNIITGGNKNDRIYLSGGNDTLNGGGGCNTLDASNLSSSVNINLASNTINTGDTISNFQNFVGTSSNDIILGSDNANTLEGGEGNDTYFAGGGNDRVVDTAGNDLIVGGDGSDSASIGDAVITDYATGEILGAQANFLVFTRSDGSTATIYDSVYFDYKRSYIHYLMKEIMRRLNLGYLRIGLLSLLTSFTLTVFAQNYSEKPVRLIVPFPPGGATDVALNL